MALSSRKTIDLGRIHTTTSHIEYALLTTSDPAVPHAQDGSHFLVFDILVQAPGCNFSLVLTFPGKFSCRIIAAAKPS